jgi:maltose/moltooligosaccharide transporter
MPKTMRQLSIVQLFSWFPLFILWVYSTTAISQHYFGVPIDFNAETETNIDIRRAFDEAGNWVGICFAMYSLVAALFSIIMPKLIKLTNRKNGIFHITCFRWTRVYFYLFL